MLFDEMGDKKSAINYELRATEILLNFLPPNHQFIQINKNHLRNLGVEEE